MHENIRSVYQSFLYSIFILVLIFDCDKLNEYCIQSYIVQMVICEQLMMILADFDNYICV